ncbi:MAG TPA: hypothetical protein VGV34_06020, partial [Solirubrobacterales bacterium]|nr:hypothetical protein [Solirubrobacterales bacterium]
MSWLAPSWLFGAQAIDAAGDPHLRAGVHLRVLPSFGLGLPVAPLQVGRIEVSVDDVESTGDVVFTDAQGRSVSPVIALAETGPVTAWLPSQPDNPVIWAMVKMDAQDGEVRVDAVLSGRSGPSALTSADRYPWQVCATGIDRLVISGEGYVESVHLLRARDVDTGGLEPMDPLALPVEGDFRYRGIDDAWSRAMDRVERGSPQLLGLHDEPEASDPWSCPSLDASEEMERVKALWSGQLEELVGILLEQSPLSQQRLRMPPQSLSETEGGPKVESKAVVPPLASVLQAALDPSVGRLLGFVAHDEDPPVAAGRLAVYVV